MLEEHNTFISWSGERSKWVAEAIHDWLQLVVQAAKPWMSATDIEKGSRGLVEVTGRLASMKVGIFCLTAENLNAPWILYEAGALSKTIDDKTRLCTYLLGGLQFQDVRPPLGMFQATNPDKEDTRRLVRTINRAVAAEPVPEKNLDQIFEKMWPDLEQKLKTMPTADAVSVAKRTPEDVLAEVLEIARAEADTMKLVQAQISHIETVLNRAPFGDYGISMFGTLATSGVPGVSPGLLSPGVSGGIVTSPGATGKSWDLGDLPHLPSSPRRGAPSVRREEPTLAEQVPESPTGPAATLDREQAGDG